MNSSNKHLHRISTRNQINIDLGNSIDPECLPGEYKTIAKFSYPEVMDLLDTNKDEIKVKGYRIKTHNPRYILFRANRFCVWCGVPTVLVYLRTQEKSKPGSYAVFTFHDIEDELLFTKDHIMPRYRGGYDVQWNYQTMCHKCNRYKGHGHPHSDRFLHPHELYTLHEKEVELLLRERFGY